LFTLPVLVSMVMTWADAAPAANRAASAQPDAIRVEKFLRRAIAACRLDRCLWD
jgi:hypothetical protein